MDTDRTLTARWGCTTATFGGRLPDKLRAMRQAGFVATEFFPRDLFEDPRGPDYSVALLQESGLRVSAYQALRDYEGMPVAHRDHGLGIAEQMMDQMAWLGAELLVLCANVHPDASDDRPRCVADLLLLAELAHSRGMRIAYSPDLGVGKVDPEVAAIVAAAVQRGDVARPRAKRRNVDGHDVQAKEEIFSEGPLTDAGREVSVRGRDEAHVDPPRLVGPEREDLLRLDGSEELGLREWRQLAHVVEEERPARCGSE